MTELVTVDINANGVADLRFNRAEKYNALSDKMFDAITEAGESLMDNKSVRAVVVSGNGRGFCAGLDFSGFQSMTGDSQDQQVISGKKVYRKNTRQFIPTTGYGLEIHSRTSDCCHTRCCIRWWVSNRHGRRYSHCST